MSAPTPPFLPYGQQDLDEGDIAAVVEALRSPYLTTGPRVEAFERAVAARVGARHGVAISNGTAALHAMYDALGVGPGDEVVVPAVTFLATANAALYVGARPVFCDVDPTSGLMTPEALRAAMTPQTKLVVPVHLAGNPTHTEALAQVAREGGARLVEDAAHAAGAIDSGVAVGACAWSEMASFSFHPVKHITTAEGGMVMTNDDALAARLRTFRSHGMTRDPALLSRPNEGPWYYEQHTLGYNYRLTDLQCALGLSQLSRLSAFITQRRALAARYDAHLAHIPWIKPIAHERPGSQSAYHLYATLLDESRLGLPKRELVKRLHARGVGTQVHYIPIPMQPYYQGLGWRAERFPGAMSYYQNTLSLPLFTKMTEGDVDRVVEALREIGAEVGA
jgi:perosamine synthetase